MTVTTHTRLGGPALSGDGAVVAATVLGRGPVAIVYSGRLAETGAEVAVKVFPDRFDRDTATRLDRERRALAAVSSPSILPVEAVGEYAGDRSTVITQLCAGSLAGMLNRGALPVSEVLAIGAAVAGALAAAHEAGVVHGGVTPHNVLFRRTGEPVLGDFGLALRERFSRDPMHALEYTAPETLRDDTRSAASDLYGLGAVLYAMLTGAPPFPRRTGQAPGERILRVLRDPVPPIQAIPGELSNLVSLLLAKDPAERPADAARVAAWFDHVRGGRGTAVASALNPLAPPVAHPDTDFDSFAGRPDLGPPQHFPAAYAAPAPPRTGAPAAPPPMAPPPAAESQMANPPSRAPRPPAGSPSATGPTVGSQPLTPRPPADPPSAAAPSVGPQSIAAPITPTTQPPADPRTGTSRPTSDPPSVAPQPPAAPSVAPQPIAAPTTPTTQPPTAPWAGTPRPTAAPPTAAPGAQPFVASGRTLIYTVSGQEQERPAKSGRWKVIAGVGACLVAVGVAAVVLTSGGESTGTQQNPTTTTTTAPKSSAAPDIGLSVTAVNDLGDRVELTWAAEGDLDFAVVVAGEGIDTMVLVAGRGHEMTVPVDAARKYCFQVRATEGRNVYTSEPVPVRGARCAL